MAHLSRILERMLGVGERGGLGETVAPRLPSFAASARKLHDNISRIVAAARTGNAVSDKRLSA